MPVFNTHPWVRWICIPGYCPADSPVLLPAEDSKGPSHPGLEQLMGWDSGRGAWAEKQRSCLCKTMCQQLNHFHISPVPGQCGDTEPTSYPSQRGAKTFIFLLAVHSSPYAAAQPRALGHPGPGSVQGLCIARALSRWPEALWYPIG